MKKKSFILFEDSRLFFLLLIFLFLFTVLVSFNGLYGQDAHEYFRYTKALHEFFITGKNPGDYFWPLLYPVSGALVSLLVPPLLSLQLISIVSFVVAFYFLEKIIVIVFQQEKLTVRIYVLLFFFLSPFMLRASVVVMSDMFCTMWIVISFYAFVKYHSLFKPKYFLIFGTVATAAVMTRYSAVVVLIIPSFILCFLFLKRFSIKYFLLTFFCCGLLMLPHFLVRSSDPFVFMKQGHLNGWSPEIFFLRSFFTSEGHATYSLPNILYGFYNWFHPGYCFCGLIVFLFFQKKYFRSKIVWTLSGSILMYAFFIDGFPYQNLRFLLLTFPLIIVVFFPAALSVWKFSSERFGSRTIFVSAFAGIQIILFVRAFSPFYSYNVFEKNVASEIKKLPDSNVYTFGLEGALQSYGVQNKMIGLGDERIDSVQNSSLLLFNEKLLKDQWQGTNVMNNYQSIIRNKKIKRIKLFENGWELSEIE